MFKQRLIPLAGAMLMLVSCGSNSNAIKLNKYFEDGGYCYSDGVNMKKGNVYRFSVSLSVLGEEELKDTDGNSTVMFINSVAEELEQYDIVNEDSVTITYNNKKLSKFSGKLEEWCEKVEAGKANYTFIYDIDEGALDQKALMFYTEKGNKKLSDKISFSFKASDNKNNVSALYFPVGMH